jgi:hypothetical protein
VNYLAAHTVDVAHIEAIDRYLIKPDTVGSTRQSEHLGRKTNVGPMALDTKTVATASVPVLPLSKVTADVLVQASPAPFVKGPLGLAPAAQSSSDGPKYWAAAVGKVVR